MRPPENKTYIAGMVTFDSQETPFPENSGKRYTNELIYASSPYLLQHAHNPVNWHAWDEAVLQKARKENKLLIISIGYSACHWCHVMERESYSNKEIARFMNAHFMAIKVDREERPDVDQIYMNASLLLNGSGGWPLNVFALPDGRPFHVLTYLPAAQWLEVLKQVVQIYTARPGKIEEQAAALTEGIRGERLIGKKTEDTEVELKRKYEELWKAVQPVLDMENGGLRKAPKFPMPGVWEFLLQYAFFSKKTAPLQAVTTTLDRMARGGIYDQLGGGFARYSVDGRWHVPHFEKMLYDNAQLISLYAHTFQYTGDLFYKKVIEETLAFIQREMTRPGGGFYSALNADSEGEEGKFYVWKTSEVKALLNPKEASLFLSYYQFTDSGNWEYGKNILHVAASDTDFIRNSEWTEEDLREILTSAREKLFDARSKRVRPSTDTKILTSWNALMIKGYVDAYKALGTVDYLKTALYHARFLEKQMIQPDHSLFRTFKDGKVSIAGLLDDYAYLVDAFIHLYEVTFDVHWLEKAKKLADYIHLHFDDNKTGMFFYTSDSSPSLIARKREVEDNVIPASNSVMAQVLYRLGCYFDSDVYKKRAREMCSLIEAETASAAPYFSNWILFMGLIQSGVYEIAITGRKASSYNRLMQKQYLPHAIFLGGIKEDLPLLKDKIKNGQTLIYICKDKICQSPLTDPEAALRGLKHE